jgi:hypothetical protein
MADLGILASDDRRNWNRIPRLNLVSSRGMPLGDGVPGCGTLLSHFSPVSDSPELRPRMVVSECSTACNEEV